MGQNKNYIQGIRSKVGHDKIILTFAGGCVFNDKGEVLLQRLGAGEWKIFGAHGGMKEYRLREE